MHNKLCAAALLFGISLALNGQIAERPRHLVSSTGALSAPSGETPRAIAEKFLRNTAPSLGLTAADLAGVYPAREYKSDHNGVTHFVFRQRFQDVDVYGASYAINVGPDGAVLNAGGDLMSAPEALAPSVESGQLAISTAVREVNPKLAGSYLAGPAAPGDKLLKFARGGFADETEGKPVWFRVNGKLHPSWLFYLPGEDASQRYLTVVDAAHQRILHKRGLRLNFQQPAGLVYERPSPQPNPTPGVRNETRPYVERTVQPFTGDPQASPRGWVTGNQTIGNNVVAGSNPLGRNQILNPTPATADSDGVFRPGIRLGPGAGSLSPWVDAATVNLFYWANVAHDKFWHTGFNEAAGNFQADNLNRGGLGGDPMLAYSQFGIASPGQPQVENAYFLPNRSFEDGARVSINMFIWAFNEAKVFADGSLDAEIIIHEYTHGVSNRLVEGAYDTYQGAAMGEGWSDFFGLEFTVPAGAPADGEYPVGEYALQSFGLGIRTRPYTTNTDVNPLHFGNMGRVGAVGPEVHDDGEIWAQALWEARAALIGQHGEREGRRRMNLLVIDGMKLAPPRPSMVDARDAILLADRVDFAGASQSQLWKAFAKRGLGAVAYSSNSDAVAVTPSFDSPSARGNLRFEWDTYTMGEEARVILHDANNTAQTAVVNLTASSGDEETLILRRKGESFYGSLPLGTDGGSASRDSYLDVVPGDYISAYYVDAQTGSGSELIQTTSPVTPEYSYSYARNTNFVSGQESPLFNLPSGRVVPFSPARVILPFGFRFFGKTYRTMYVYGNGFIQFDTPTAYYNGCGTAAFASQTPTIAPLWTELAYGGFAQPRENVYISAGTGSVTVRWAAETIFTGEPASFSVVLYDDGRMMFQYPSGVNNNLANTNLFGCQSTTPFVGISSGKGSYVQEVPDFMGTPSLDSFPSIVWDAPFNYSSFPVVRLETPEADGKYSGVLTVRGVAYDTSDAIARLDVLIDGRPRRLILPGANRADFCSSNPVRGCPNVGFSSNIDLASFGIEPGEHTIQILATNTRGAFRKFPETPVAFTVQPGQSRLPVGRIETPAEGATVTGVSQIRGYVYAADLGIVSVDVVIDGTTYGQATYGVRRDDICGTLTPRPLNCPGVGFQFNLNSATGFLLPTGKHGLQIRARDQSGRFTLIPETPVTINVENPSNLPPTGVMLNPAPNATLTGTVKIWGWAWDNDGTVRTVQLLVDGNIYQTLSYGDARPEQCATLPEVRACPNIGFWGDFDTNRITNGLHQIGVRLVDNSGNATIIPKLTGYGQNVTVQN